MWNNICNKFITFPTYIIYNIKYVLLYIKLCMEILIEIKLQNISARGRSGDIIPKKCLVQLCNGKIILHLGNVNPIMI